MEDSDQKVFGNNQPSGSDYSGKTGLHIDLDDRIGDDASLFSGKSESQRSDSEEEAKPNTKTFSESEQSARPKKRAHGDKGRVMMKKNPGDDNEAVLKAKRAKSKAKLQELLNSDDESTENGKPFKCPHCPAGSLKFIFTCLRFPWVRHGRLASGSVVAPTGQRRRRGLDVTRTLLGFKLSLAPDSLRLSGFRLPIVDAECTEHLRRFL